MDTAGPTLHCLRPASRRAGTGQAAGGACDDASHAAFSLQSAELGSLSLTHRPHPAAGLYVGHIILHGWCTIDGPDHYVIVLRSSNLLATFNYVLRVVDGICRAMQQVSVTRFRRRCIVRTSRACSAHLLSWPAIVSITHCIRPK